MPSYRERIVVDVRKRRFWHLLAIIFFFFFFYRTQIFGVELFRSVLSTVIDAMTRLQKQSVRSRKIFMIFTCRTALLIVQRSSMYSRSYMIRPDLRNQKLEKGQRTLAKCFSSNQPWIQINQHPNFGINMKDPSSDTKNFKHRDFYTSVQKF